MPVRTTLRSSKKITTKKWEEPIEPVEDVEGLNGDKDNETFTG